MPSLSKRERASLIADIVAALRTEGAVSTLVAAQPAVASPKATDERPAAIVAAFALPKGERQAAARLVAKAQKLAGFYCARHDHGFAYKRETCPRDGLPL